MTQIGFRDLDAMIMGTRAEDTPPAAAAPTAAPAEPAAAPPPLPASQIRAEAAGARVFSADRPHGTDVLARQTAIARLAELAVHARTETPLCIGLLGASGVGKSFALSQLVAATTGLAAAAAKTERSPFLSNVLVRPVDAATLEGDPATALAGELFEALAAAHPEIAAEAAHAVRDPHIAVREATERHDSIRRLLETERRGLEEADSRRARLVETLLYETPGAQIDAYARANRGRIETALARFGVCSEALRTYKDLVRTTSESGAGGRVGLTLRALWAFKGQTKLIVTAILLILVGIGLGIASDTRATWIAWLRNSNPQMAPAATWADAHIALLTTLQEVAFAAAALAIIANLWRAARLLQPVFRGVALLNSDIAQRRRDLDTALAHQTRRVDGLAGDAETAGRRLAEAQRRADARGPGAALAEPSPFGPAAGRGQAQRFVEAVTGLAATAGAPQRIVLALDNLDGVPAPRAQEIMAAAHRLLRPSIVLVAAADPARLGRDAGALDTWIQVPFRLQAAGAPGGHAHMVQALLDTPKPVAVPTYNAKTSALDQHFTESEVALLTAVAPLAGDSPRAVKRLVNLYRLARADAGAHRGTTALMLALNAGGAPLRATLVDWLAGRPDDAPVDLADVMPTARPAIESVAAIEGGTVTAGALRAGMTAAAPYTLAPHPAG